jgi:hypothetical protein
VWQTGSTPLHHASSEGRLDIVRFLVEQCGADVHVKDSFDITALGECTGNAKSEIAAFLRQHMEPKPKMYALCMGLHRRLGVDSPLKMLNVDVMQQIANHMDL